MKKITSILLALCLVLSVIPFAGAFADEDEGSEPEKIEIEYVSVSTGEIILKQGKTYRLTADIYPENANKDELRWTSLNPSVATVDNFGLVTAVAEGTADIKVSTADGKVMDYAHINVPSDEIRATKFKGNTWTDCMEYDVNGDCLYDDISLVAYDDEYGMADQAYIYINDKKVKTVSTYFYADNSCFYVIHLGNDEYYLCLSLAKDNDDTDVYFYRFENNGLTLVTKPEKTQSASGYHFNMSNLKVSERTITYDCMKQVYGVGIMKYTASYTAKNGELVPAKSMKIKSYAGKTYCKTLTSKQKIRRYKSATASKSSSTVKKGTKMKLTDIYVSGSRVRIKYKKENGKTGWFKPSKSYSDTMFKGTYYAG